MARINPKEIRDRVTRMNNGWTEGAPTVEFGGVKRTDFSTDIEGATTAENELADILAQADIKRAEIDSRYQRLQENSVRVANGVRGDKDFGEDSALYGAMGFVRKSERASGLTRKPKTTK